MFTATLVNLALLPIYLIWGFCIFAAIFFVPGCLAIFVGSRWLSGPRRARAVYRTDARVVAASVGEGGEPLVSLSRKFVSLRNRANVGETSSVLCRMRVGQLLEEAQTRLGDGARLMVTECYRSELTEREFQNWKNSVLRHARPWISRREVSKELSRLKLLYRQSGHSTGGAIDVTLTCKAGVELDLGPRVRREMGNDGIPVDPASTFRVVANRKMLFDALEGSGFVNDAMEWWHWSYGDRYWQAVTGSALAQYSELTPRQSRLDRYALSKQ